MSTISLTIRILDKDYQVNCKPEERSALEESARLLNGKMEEIRRKSHVIGLERIAVMAALNMANDLLKAEKSATEGTQANTLVGILDSKLSAALNELNS